MAPKSFVAASLLGIALVLAVVVVVIAVTVPASALGQCGETGCGRIFKDDCSSNQRCVERYGGYYCVDDPTCSAIGAPTVTATQAPSTTGSSCSSVGGVCRYWTGFYCWPNSETDVGKKDCGSAQTCCIKAAATPAPVKVTSTKTPVPTKTTAPAGVVSGGETCGAVGGSCELFYCGGSRTRIGQKDCGFLRTCCKTPETSKSVCGNGKCEAGETYLTCSDCPKPVNYYPGAMNDTWKSSTCGNGVCETGLGKETYQTCPQDCPKPTGTTSIAKCSDGTPRFACSNSTVGKYCDGLGKLVTLARCGAATPTPAVTAATRGDSPRTDPAFAGAKFKEPFVFFTAKVAAQYGGEDSLMASIQDSPKSMSSWLLKFHTGIAIDNFKSAGVKTPENGGALNVLDELTQQGCGYLREHGIATNKNQFFVWLIDEDAWKSHMDAGFVDKSGVGWPDKGILVMVPSYYAGGLPLSGAQMTHEFSHLWGISDRTGSGDTNDLMYNNPIPMSPVSFGDAQKITLNQDKKLNSC